MAINFPLTKPASPNYRMFDLDWEAAVAMSRSPYDSSEQVHEYGDRPMRFSAELPPINDRTELGQWEAFLLALRNGVGTFVDGDPRHTSLMGNGPGSDVPDFPTTQGATSAGSKTINTRGWGANRAAFLKVGDRLQLAKNYLTHPTAIDNAVWTVNEATKGSANAITDPEGIATAERVTPAGGATDAYVKQAVAAASLPSVAAGFTYTFVVWLKAASGTPSVNIILQEEGGSLSQSACALTTSWQRFSVSRTLAGGSAGLNVYVGGNGSWVVAEGAVDIWGGILYSAVLDARLVLVPWISVLGGGPLAITADPTGFATNLEVLPRVRAALPDMSPIITSSAVGTWRLAPGAVERSLALGLIAGLGFDAIEAINL